MQHRHLIHQDLTLAAIDDVISRGDWKDWVTLRLAALNDSAILDKVSRVCQAHIADAYAQRYHFWHHYVQAHRSAT
jgi:hypothetical protein